jgi:hypothetical protein
MGYDKRGPGNPRWKGGRRMRRDGYILVYSPGHPFASKNFVLEHRIVMEKHIGRYLAPQETVHHTNRVRSDNRIENLLLTDRRNHMKHHAGEKRPRWKPKISRAALAVLYLVDGLTVSECGKKIGISHAAMYRHFKEFRIGTRKANPQWPTHRKIVVAGNRCRQSGAEAIRVSGTPDSGSQTRDWRLQSCRT